MESIGRKIKILKSRNVQYFFIKKAEMIDERKNIYTEMK